MNKRVILLASLVAGCGPSIGSGDDGGADVIGGVCTPGLTRCDGNTLVVCNADNRWEAGETCPNVCADGLGCVLCQPGTGTCSGTMSTMCRDDGMGYVDVFCDPLQGMACDFEIGVCSGDCAPQNLGKNYIGCEYYPTVTGNEVDNAFEFAIAVSNTTSQPANVHIEGGALGAPLMIQAQPGTVAVQKLPWVPKLKACTNAGGALECGAPMESSSLVVDGAYHLRSDHPVTVYQFNPLDYRLPTSGCMDGFATVGCSYTNDASLLLPVNVMTGNYYVAAYPAWPWTVPFPGFMTITATRDGTQVTVAATANTDAGGGLPALQAGVAQAITLNAGDAAQFFSTTGDLTGSLVQASAPVQVIGGHYCTQVPNGITACDHMEESMFPFEALDNMYIVNAPVVPSLPNGKIRVVRIVATEANTILTYDPPQPTAPASITSAGQFAEIVGTRETFLVSANAKILVAQYMEGQEAEGGTGDPAMTLAVPVGQYRTDYQFHAPQNYSQNYVDVIAPTGATVFLDGTQLAGFTPVGNSGYGLLRVLLTPKTSGNYQITGDDAFGITVYGYGSWTSYYYPGGLDLAPIVVE